MYTVGHITVLCDAQTFSHVFYSWSGCFSTFLKSEFSEENVEFWLPEDFKKTESAEKIASKARMIYSEFIE